MKSELGPAAIEWQTDTTEISERIADIALKQARIYELNEKIDTIKHGYEWHGKFTLDEYLDALEPLLQEMYALTAQANHEIGKVDTSEDSR